MPLDAKSLAIPSSWKDVLVRAVKAFISALVPSLLAANWLTGVNGAKALILSSLTTAGNVILNAVLKWSVKP